ncbi:MAG: hypothetical protein JJU29_23585 [Verrucomicrobia bacterium]|nr:hypothetical protein [Verrucomicrobiota bacterium]MCH8510345.1 hypothetical protein [Kiritimatiellia bacterium]
MKEDFMHEPVTLSVRWLKRLSPKLYQALSPPLLSEFLSGSLDIGPEDIPETQLLTLHWDDVITVTWPNPQDSMPPSQTLRDPELKAMAATFLYAFHLELERLQMLQEIFADHGISSTVSDLGCLFVHLSVMITPVLDEGPDNTAVLCDRYTFQNPESSVMVIYVNPEGDVVELLDEMGGPIATPPLLQQARPSELPGLFQRLEALLNPEDPQQADKAAISEFLGLPIGDD